MSGGAGRPARVQGSAAPAAAGRAAARAASRNASDQQEAVRPEEHEVHEPGAQRATRSGEEQAAGARVGRRLGVGDHEEGEEQQGAVLAAGGAGWPAARRARATRPNSTADVGREEREASRRCAPRGSPPGRRGRPSGSAKKAALPHCPGETQAPSVASSSATRAKLVGLKTCLPRTRRTNLLRDGDDRGERRASSGESVRSSRQSERPEIRALRASKAGSRQSRVQRAWTARTPPSRTTAFRGGDLEVQAGHAIDQQRGEHQDLVAAGILEPEAAQRGVGHGGLLQSARARPSLETRLRRGAKPVAAICLKRSGQIRRTLWTVYVMRT